MEATLEHQVRELVDRQQIHDLLLKFCRGVDRMDFELMASVYHPDASDDHGPYRGDVPGLLRFIDGYQRERAPMIHFLGNSLIEFQDDSHASGETYCIARGLRTLPEEGAVIRETVVRYIDRFERRNGGPWLIAHRTCVLEWRVQAPPGDADPRELDGFVRQRRDTEDLSYRVLSAATAAPQQ